MQARRMNCNDAVESGRSCGRAMTQGPWFDPSGCGTCGLLSILIHHTLVHTVLVPSMIHNAFCHGRECSSRSAASGVILRPTAAQTLY